VTGKSGSVAVTLKPAPRGLGLAGAEVPSTILKLAGVRDAWTTSRGETRTTINFAFATFEALKQTTRMSIPADVKVTLGRTGEAVGEAGGG
jgi:small subunit ribosomal protein S5